MLNSAKKCDLRHLSWSTNLYYSGFSQCLHHSFIFNTYVEFFIAFQENINRHDQSTIRPLWLLGPSQPHTEPV